MTKHESFLIRSHHGLFLALEGKQSSGQIEQQTYAIQGTDTSPASFEKSLSATAKKIGLANASLEASRQQSRRLKALWTLYTSIAYLLYFMIVALVIGIKNGGIAELGALIGAPLVIYGVREAIARFYAYRNSNKQAHLETLQKQRDGIITKLKEATKYDSTQQLLEKYGGTPPKPQNPLNRTDNQNRQRDPLRPDRPMLIPPSTANVPRGPLTAPNALQNPQSGVSVSNPPLTAAAATPPWAQQHSPVESSAEFAPNAFPPSHYYAQTGTDLGAPRWYDRFLDVLLGEDESHPKNRIILICKNCRLVNGQAPPGTKSLADIGKWRCSSCGKMNGEDTEMQKIVAEIQDARSSNSMDTAKIEETEEHSPTPNKDDETENDIMPSSEDEDISNGNPNQSGRETLFATVRKGRKFEE